MKGVLNETTLTVHKHPTGTEKFRTACGASYHVARDQLRLTEVERATDELSARKCGRCFDDAGGY